MPTARPPQRLPPAEFCATLIGLTPGVNVSSWVKFRPFNGRSFAGFVVTIVPSSDVVESTADRCAVTVSGCCEDPTVSPKSSVAVWLTCSGESAAIG